MDKKVYVATAVILIGVIGAVGALITLQPVSSGPAQYTYTLVKTYPHDTSAYTEGLLIDGGVLYESTGEYGASSLRRVDLESGVVQQEVELGSDCFGEGLALVGDRLVQLTWRNRVGFVYDKGTLSLIGNFSYGTEGWGLTYDGTNLIMSDGTCNLYLLDPNSFQQTGHVSVHDGNSTITEINELEYVNGDIYANIWHSQTIAIINPQTGEVKGWIDLSGLYPQSGENVLNGIAYDKVADRLFVTGKDWASLFEIEIVPK
jgi:glutamine cyclotransferase